MTSELKAFVMNPEQKYTYKVLKLLQKQPYQPRIRIFKARKRGISTFFVGHMLHTFTFSNRVGWGQIYGHKKESGSTQTLFEILTTFYDNLSPEYRWPLRTGRLQRKGLTLVFESGTRIEARTILSEGVSRGDTPDYYLLTEVAHYPDAANTIKELLSSSTQSPHVMVVEETTSNGFDDYWYQSHVRFDDLVKHLSKKHAGEFKKPTWEEEVKGDTTAVRLLRAGLWPKEPFHIFIPWFWNPENQIIDEDDLDFQEVIEAPRDYYLSIKERFKLTWNQVAWYHHYYKKFGRDDIFTKQEYPCTPDESFVTTGDTFLPAESIDSQMEKLRDVVTVQDVAVLENVSLDTVIHRQKLLEETLQHVDLFYVKAPVMVRDNLYKDQHKVVIDWKHVLTPTNETFTIFDPPQAGYHNRYCLGVDPSSGKERSNPEVITVFDRHKRRFVAYIEGLFGADRLPEVIAKVAAWYNFAHVMIENNMGEAVLVTLTKIYPVAYILSDTRRTRGFDQLRYHDYGVRMTPQTKELMAARLKAFFEEISADPKRVGIPFDEALKQLRAFTKELKASGKGNDDIVLAMMIALHADYVLGLQGQVAREKSSTHTYVVEPPSYRCY